MKKLTTAIPCLLALCLCVLSVQAQQAGTASQSTTQTASQSSKKSKSSGVKKSSGRADAQLADLATNLNLTEDQKAKIKPVLDDEYEKMHAVKAAKTGSADDQKAKTKAIRSDANSQIRALLTADQQPKFDAMSKKSHKKAPATQS